MTHFRDGAALRAVVVGCGNIAANHAAAYRALPGVDLVACCDVDPARAGAFAAEHEVPSAVADLDELLALAPAVVSVCTPHPTHEQVVTAAAARGAHVLCEKPIAIEHASAARMVQACADAGVTLGVLFQRRFWPAVARIRRALDTGLLGTPILGHASVLLHRDPEYYTAAPWRGSWQTDGGGVLMTQAIHFVDLLQWFTGEVVEVSARYDTFRHGRTIEVEDTLVATLRFRTGALATLSASTALAPGLGSQLQVTGSTGATVGLSEYPDGAEAITHLWAVPGQEEVGSPFGPGLVPDLPLSVINGGHAPFHARQIADFVDAVRTGGTPAVSGHEAMKSLAIVTAIYASAASGRPAAVPAATYPLEQTR